MTALRFYTDGGLHEWANLRHYHSSVPVVLRWGTGSLIPFCHFYDTTGEDIDDVIVEYLDGHELTLDDTGDFEIETDGTYDWIIYNGDAVQSGAADLDTGLARIRIEMDGGTTFWSDYFELCDLDVTVDCGKDGYDNYFNLYFSAEHDLDEPYNIIYQTGYENHLIFDTLPIKPDNSINVEGETDEAQDEFITYQSQKKIYNVEIIGGQSLFDMLSVIKMHEYIYIKWPCEDLRRVQDIDFTYEWVEDFLCRMTLSFNFYNLEVSECCNEYSPGHFDLEIVESGFDDWFLPSQWELYFMWDNLHHTGIGGNDTPIGNFDSGAYYWSSFENDALRAVMIDFAEGNNWNDFKSAVHKIRCARSFTDTSGLYTLRSRGPGGGWIFYIDGNTYYECAPFDCPDHEWSNVHNGLIGTTNQAVGEGQNNTNEIIAQAGHTDSAANSCDGL